MNQDRKSKIGGLPQRLGKVLSIAIAIFMLIAAGILFANNPVSKDFTSISDNG